MSAADRAMEAGGDKPPATVKVWDRFVRLFHWSLVAVMAYEFIFEAGTAAHIYLGYAVLALIAARLIWGLVGSPYARFSEFAKSPMATVRYLFDILKGHPKRYLGHNPAGAAMVLALLMMVTVTAATGYAMTTNALWGEEWIEELHKVSANITLFLIFAHVAGVALASWQHRENLVKAMVTGEKSVDG